ncbi:AMP-binding protein [Polaribacter sp.]|nr:AMP-binding protein [Polaribacter sp.]|tara:strand:- start:2602 stop:3690 length:1089 start_codon:yes stop_codon:yes gene_type:complete
MKMNFHKSFQLNGRGFATSNEIIDFSNEISLEISLFLKNWFSENPSIDVNTSGSTGAPKTITIKKDFFINSALSTGEFLNLKEGTTTLMCLPPNYIAGKMMLVRALVLGWHLDVVSPKANPLENSDKTYDFTAMVPLQLENSLEKITQIKKVIVGGGVVSPQLQEKLQGVQSVVFATYGMTETVTHIAFKKLNHFSASPGVKSMSSFYQLLPNVKVYKDTRNCLVIDAPRVSQEVIFTNDVVDLISDRLFEWLGRFDNVINSGGIKLHPEKIEEKLSKIIAQRFFVAGIPDTLLGEKLILIVELESNNVSNFQQLFSENIKNLSTLSKYEIPKEVRFLKAFVETETKKIQRSKTLDLIVFIN